MPRVSLSIYSTYARHRLNFWGLAPVNFFASSTSKVLYSLSTFSDPTCKVDTKARQHIKTNIRSKKTNVMPGVVVMPGVLCVLN